MASAAKMNAPTDSRMYHRVRSAVKPKQLAHHEKMKAMAMHDIKHLQQLSAGVRGSASVMSTDAEVEYYEYTRYFDETCAEVMGRLYYGTNLCMNFVNQTVDDDEDAWSTMHVYSEANNQLSQVYYLEPDCVGQFKTRNLYRFDGVEEDSCFMGTSYAINDEIHYPNADGLYAR
jgi:hypothetical protein